MIRRIEKDFNFSPLEVTSQECGGDTTKMIKRFMKKTRKEEVLKPFYEKLLFWETKSQKARKKKLRAIHEHKKMQRKIEELDTLE